MHLKEAGKKPAVLMNELGKVSIDSSEVDSDTPLKELLDGCICCTIQEKLEAQLQELLYEKDWDVLVIETTGAAHPVEVMDSVLSPLFADQFLFKGIITTVDAKRWLNRSELSPQILHLLREQVKYASLLVVNKTDEIKELDKGNISYELSSLNPSATILLTTYSSVPSHLITELSTSEEGINLALTTRESTSSPLRSYVYSFKGSIKREKFMAWLESLPSSVFRIKGFVPFQETTYPELFQYSFGMPIFLSEDMRMPTNLVIIGQNLSIEDISTQLKTIDEVDG
ncbi:GTP-binding protein [Bacillus coahuilensis]|uniref:CobW family GTP-binding protein n=2 Tax=Bacillus coahuilensis TaxID=408580 RepID=UPI00307ADD16